MIRIGDFARLARVSVRALRLYEEKGLLEPARVDSRSRYRYYDLQQLAALERLLALKELGLSLAAIRALRSVSSRDLRLAISRHRELLRRQLREHEAKLARVDALESWIAGEGDDARDMAVRTKSYPQVRALCLRAQVTPGSEDVAHLFDQAERRARRSRTDEAPMLLMHGGAPAIRQLDVEVCVPVARTCKLADVREIEAEPFAASVTYRGPYANTDDVYRKMRQWLSHQGLVLADRPIREVYHRFGADQIGYRLPAHRVTRSPHRYVTELAIPIARAVR